jgi:hypothetical protein
MKPVADAFDGAIPRLQQFRMSYRLIPAAQDFRLMCLAQFIAVVTEQLSTMFFEPNGQTLSLFWSQLKNRRLQLFQAHTITLAKVCSLANRKVALEDVLESTVR